jgi:membrane fusion protein (multidrug efflux system)
VKVNSSQAGQWIVTGGLAAGDRVIVDGFQKMMVPGAPVNPVPWSAKPAGGPAGAAPKASAPAAAATPASAASR